MIVASKKSILILGGTLLAQLAFAALLLMPQGEGSDPLVIDEIDRADRFVISSADDDPIELALADGDWFLPGELPVDTSRLDSMLEVLASDRWTWPVASTSEAARRFEVTEDDFQRRIKAFAGEDELATLYLGTSPSFRRIHARESESENIYAIELATYDLPMRQDDWLDKSILQTAGAVDAIERVGEWNAELDGEGNWQLVEPSQEAKSEELSGMATRFETLRIMGLAEEQPDQAPDLEFEVSAVGETIRYAFYRPPEEEGEGEESESEDAEETPEFDASTRDTLVKSSVRDEFFRVSSFTVDQLDKAIEELIVEEDAVQEESEGGDSHEVEAEVESETDSDLSEAAEEGVQ